ncbi:alpha/beta hydrolase [Zhengella mangrovi]|uniref:Alpha/beta hydrolase n=1 Tax=Zhengella mangrovi TaxID=1982044 RepID=A0A2G1QR57_9HYPH|nr:alpha/beta hydrolase [Zhengella mangrovi]PHP68027.1 alpha/beta hydrolase [Zhengella mangrovi]
MFQKIAIAIGISIAVYFSIAVALVLSEAPPPGGSDTEEGGSLDFASAMTADYSDMPDVTLFKARDGTDLAYRRYDSVNPDAPYLILVHGSGWNSMQWHPLAKWLAGEGLATVIAPDMRGHGVNPPPRGDVGYIGQLEDDMADLITLIKQPGDAHKVILGGHSSGGGFVVRFAGGKHGDRVDGYVLMAPFLKYDAPTMRPNSGGWARPATRRIIGLVMLNRINFPALNHLPVVSFDMPKAVLDGPYGKLATTEYTYRMNVSFAPRDDYQADLAAMTKPLLVVAGDRDEAFKADQFEPVISARTKSGTYAVLPGITHLGVVTGEEVRPVLKDWLAANFPASKAD